MKSLANPIVMKEVNTDIVRNVMRVEKQATKQRLSELTGLSTVTIGTILNQLVGNKEVYEAELVPSTGGRPAMRFCYNAEFSHALIIYTHVQLKQDTVFISVINLFGECVFQKKCIVEEIHLSSFEALIDEMIERYPTIKGIGFGLPGMEYDNVMMINDYEYLSDTCFTQHYKDKYNIPVIVENDVNLAVLGYYHGQLIEGRSAVYVYFPQKYEPGAGIFINGDLHKGINNFAGEIKYLPLGIDWRTINYLDVDTICKAISNVVITISCIINPENIIIAGDFLSDAHVHAIMHNCKQTMDKIFIPKIFIAKNFNLDFENGLKIRSLELLKTYKSLY